MRLFDRYFDDFESLATDERLNLLMGVRGADTFTMFRPTFTVYADGEVRLSRRSFPDLEEEEKRTWIAITSDLVKGVRVLAA